MPEERVETESIESQPGEAALRILVIDNEEAIGLGCQRILEPEGHEVRRFSMPAAGLQAALSGEFDIVLLDLMMPELGGLEILRQLRDQGVPSEVIIITGHATVESAVAAMKQGAYDYVSKPFSPDQLRLVVRRAAEYSRLIRENVVLRQELEIHQGFEGIVGESRPMGRVFALARRVAPTDGSVLLIGESGTGKEMFVRAIHRLSRRKDHPLLACDCSALAPTLLESELFGHVKGSFSGAIVTKQGLFEAAHRGTLFLDEIGNLSMETQGKLLRALETRRVKKVGDTTERERRYSPDFGHQPRPGRNGSRGRVPRGPLLPAQRRARPLAPAARPQRRHPPAGHDLPRPLLQEEPVGGEGFFVRGDGTDRGLCVARQRPRAAEHRRAAGDPLRLRANRAAAPAGGNSPVPGPRPSGTPLPRSWEEFKRLKQQVRDAAVQQLERRFLQDVLERCGGNVTRTADEIGIQRTNLHALMRKHGLT